MKKLFGVAILVLSVSACKTTEPLYYHGAYNQAVYAYFKAEDITLEEQINILQETIQAAANAGKSIAPGVHAHLGLLYFDSGNADLGKQHFEQEKQLFPESAKYLDFLLTSRQGA